MGRIEIRQVGHVESSLKSRHGAPRQPDEGGPSAWLVFEARVRDALSTLRVGDRIIVLTWLNLADREVLRVYPRGDQTRGLSGVFSTRSPDRPNPIGLHEVIVTGIDDLRVQVDHLEATDGTPVLDIKPALACNPPDR